MSESDGGMAVWRRRTLVAIVVLIAGTVPLVVAGQWFPHLSGDNDEAVYLQQAELAQEGRFTLPVSGEVPTFQPWLSGEYQGRLVFAFNPPFPVWIALVKATTTTTDAVYFSSGAVLALSVYLFGCALLGDHRRALACSAMVGLTPLLVVQSALLLTYVPALCLALLVLHAYLRAIQQGTARWALQSGLVFGALFWTRPYDAVLTAAVVLAISVEVLRRKEAVPWTRLLVAAAGGAAVLVVPCLVFNSVVTGSPWRFPVVISGGENIFGFGQRSVGVGDQGLDYTVGTALRTQVLNVAALPTWLIGGWVSVPLAAWGWWISPRRVRVALAALSASVVVGYFFWWATALAAPGALNGIGPHYLLMFAVALAMGSLLGVLDLVSRVSDRRGGLLGTVGVVVALTVAMGWVHLPDKIEDKTRQTARFEAWNLALESLPTDRNLLVVLNDDQPSFLGADVPTFINDVHRSNRVVFANAVGPQSLDVPEAAGREVWSLRPEIRQGDSWFVPTVVAEPVVVFSAPCMEVRVDVASPVVSGEVAGYVDWVGADVQTSLAQDPTFGERFTFTALLDGVGSSPSDSFPIAVGIEYDPDGTTGPSVSQLREWRFNARNSTGMIEVFTPGSYWHRTDFEGQPWLRIADDGVVSVSLSSVACE